MNHDSATSDLSERDTRLADRGCLKCIPLLSGLAQKRSRNGFSARHGGGDHVQGKAVDEIGMV